MIGKQSIALARGHHRIRVETAYPLLLSAGGEPIRALAAGSHSFVSRLNDPVELQVDPTEPKAPYSLLIASKEIPYGEKTDDIPPPEPPAPDNYLQQLRYKVRQQMGVTREAFADRQSPYEIGDMPPLFEEEEKIIADKRAAAAKLKAEAAKAEAKEEPPKPAPEPESKKDEKSPTPPEPSSV